MFFLQKLIKNSSQHKALLIVFLLVANCFTATAGGPPVPSTLSNPLALTLVTLMVVLLIIIFMLGQLLTGIAEVKLAKEKEEKKAASAGTTVAMIGGLLLLSSGVMAQDVVSSPAVEAIGGISATIFYIMLGILFIEMLVILALIINIRFLLRKDDAPQLSIVYKKKTPAFANLWNRMNKFKPVEQEREIELDHEYDGIKELDNRLPPWWLYGFYVSIIFSVVYLWRYHVAYSAPLSKEELEISIKKADEDVKAYLALKGETVDENTVTILTSPQDLADGKKIFTTACVACHKDDGGGLVGPNLTDDYWMHGGDIKSIFKTIKYGINAMPPWQNSYSNKQLAQVASYVKSLHGTNPAGAKAHEGELYQEEDAAK